MTTPPFEFYFDFHSPYSYLAATQLPFVEHELGIEVQWRPMLLGGVFKATGNRSPAALQHKARYLLTDLQRWAAWYRIPLHWPDWFPGDSLTVMRATVAAFDRGRDAGVRFSQTAFRAAWVENVDLSMPEAIVEVAALSGLPGRELLAEARSARTKERLRANTDRAVALGGFGAPLFVIDREIFWGNDRLEMALHHYRQLLPPPEADSLESSP